MLSLRVGGRRRDPRYQHPLERLQGQKFSSVRILDGGETATRDRISKPNPLPIVGHVKELSAGSYSVHAGQHRAVLG